MNTSSTEWHVSWTFGLIVIVQGKWGLHYWPNSTYSTVKLEVAFQNGLVLYYYICCSYADYLDNGNNKMAIQQADKLLKKHKDLHCAKVSVIAVHWPRLVSVALRLGVFCCAFRAVSVIFQRPVFSEPSGTSRGVLVHTISSLPENLYGSSWWGASND